MKTLKSSLCCIILVLLIFPSHVYAQGTIQGSAQLKLDDGHTLFADWVRVLLTTAPVYIPPAPDFSGMDSFARMEGIRDLHMAFFVNVREKMNQKDYLFDSTLTTPEGKFHFSDVPPGQYFIVVTFPAMIDDYKVAWQIPVQVKQDEVAPIVLNHENMAVPTYTRSN